MQFHSKCGLGTDLIFVPAQMKNQNSDILKLKAWMTSTEALKLVTRDDAQRLAFSGPCNLYPGKLGVVEVDTLADLLLVDGDPIADISLIADPERNFLVIMKDGKVYKNTLV
jgi:imidazolonepropionase-like amidohydrolase